MTKQEEILQLLHSYKTEVDNFNDAIFVDKFDEVAEKILPLFCEHPFNAVYQSETECRCEKCGKDLTS